MERGRCNTDGARYRPEGAKIGRSFPCSAFTVRRHLKERFVVDIECGGEVLEPDVMLPPFTDDDWRGHRVPEDGRLIADTTYGALKEDRLRRARAPRGWVQRRSGGHNMD